MALTPADVHKKTFTPVRLREGYDMGEVDQFLDEVEVELTRLHEENDDLRSKVSAASTGSPAPQAPVVAPEPTAVEKPELPAPAVAALPAVKTVPEASTAAARLLEIAAQNADQLVGEAKSDAERIVGEARTNAERLETESKTKADRLESDARTRSQMLDSEVAERRNQLFGDLEKEKGRLDGEIENLRAFEREYRSRLKSYFSQQLASLESDDSAGSAPGSPSLDAPSDVAPKRLRSLLGDDES